MNVIKQTDNQLLDKCIELSEKSFYPPTDKRHIKSGICDIRGGDSFYDYVVLFDKYCLEYNDF